MRKLLKIARIVASAALLLSGLGYAGYIHYGYKKGQSEYTKLMEVYTRPGKEEKQRSKDPYGSISEEKTRENAMPGKTIWRPLINQLPKDAPDRIEVDWEALQKKNEDLIAWILIPSVEISYPVLQGDDNEYYLHRDFNREYLYAGSIFMDKDNSPSFINYNTILYGHNMRDGSMFAGLKDFLDVGAYQLCRYFWVLTPEADLLYECKSQAVFSDDGKHFFPTMVSSFF